MTRVTPMANAAGTPNIPSANTSLASRAPNPPGKGTSRESQPAVHAAMLCQADNWIFRNLTIRANSATMLRPAQMDIAAAANKDDKCRRQKAPANRSEAARKRTGLDSLLTNGRRRSRAEIGYFRLYKKII